MAEPTTRMLRAYRRDLHRIPELDFDLPKTLAYLRSVLCSLPGAPEVFSPCKSTLCCYFDFCAAHTTAIRTDMDALPVTERTGARYASTHPGRMHACGHDGHMSMALGLAHYLSACADGLPRNVLIVFQPAEETTGGARLVAESGVFERYRADRIFGFHLWPDLPAGHIASRPGALLAAANETTVTFAGRASHIAKAAGGADALEAAARYLPRAYELVDGARGGADAADGADASLLKFGRMEAGSVRNQIAAEARLEGSLRTFSTSTRDRLMQELAALADEVAAQGGCSAQTHFSGGYPPVVNDAALYGAAQAALPGLGRIGQPLLIAEDFSYYQQHMPGVFLLLGTGTGIPLHADTFDFDERILAVGVEAYKRLVAMP